MLIASGSSAARPRKSADNEDETSCSGVTETSVPSGPNRVSVYLFSRQLPSSSTLALAARPTLSSARSGSKRNNCTPP